MWLMSVVMVLSTFLGSGEGGGSSMRQTSLSAVEGDAGDDGNNQTSQSQ
jgi:hypothetical protein